MPRPFAFSPFFGIDGSVLVNNWGEIASEQEMNRFFSMAESELDRLTLEMCAVERKKGRRLEEWELQAETSAFLRIRARGKAA